MQSAAGCSASNGLPWAETEVFWSQSQFLRTEISFKDSKKTTKQSKIIKFDVSGFLAFLRLFFLTAAIIEVKVVGGDLQAAWDNRHDGDELALFRQNQFFFLALVLPLHPDDKGEGYICI